MAKYLLAVLLVLSGGSVYGQVPLVIDPQFDQSRIDFNLWNNVVVPMHDKLTISLAEAMVSPNWTLSHPPNYPKLQIEFAPGDSASGCGKLTLASYPLDKSNLSDGVYFTLSHLYGHSKLCSLWMSLDVAEEGRVESEVYVTYRELSKINPAIKPTTTLFISSTLNNLPLNVTGGAKTFYDNINEFAYALSAAKFEILINKLPGKNFTRLHQKLNNTTGSSYTEYFALLDRICLGKIDGVLCSTFFQDNPATFENSPDGKFFGLYAFRHMDQGGWLSTKSAVNPTLVRTLLIQRTAGVDRFDTSANPVFWQIRDAAGNVELTSPPNAVINQQSIDSGKLPEGGYKLEGCLGTICSSFETSFFPVYRKNWERGKIIIIGNGPNFADLTNQTWLTLVNPSVGVTTENYPGMLVVNLNGSTDDIVVTNGQRVRAFTPDRELTRIVLFTQRDQPYLYSVTNGANFKVGSVVPGSIATLFTWGATHTDPEQAASLPLTNSSCKGGQGETRVLFIQNGVETKAPFYYCSQRQLNVQAPSQLQTGVKAQVCVELNSVRSCKEVDVVETDPGIFVTDWATKSGAIIQDGRNLSIYATGLGAVNTPPADGTPALSEPLSITTNQPTVILDGAIDCPVVFSGLAPEFVGLYQVNCLMPTEVTPGKHNLALSIRNADSNTVSVSIQ